jgi:GNAT superfamily N-acetyltransferase
MGIIRGDAVEGEHVTMAGYATPMTFNGGKMIDIRRVEPDDAIEVAALVSLLFNELDPRPGDPLNNASSTVDLTKVAQDVLSRQDRVSGYLAVAQGQAVGVLLLHEGYAMFAKGVFGQITELYVRPEYRSSGVAARLVEAATEFGKGRGWRRIDVGAPDQPRWHRTLNFYKTHGFVEVGPRLRLDL